MGYTQFTINKIEGILNEYRPIYSVLDLGAQNNYSLPLENPENAPYMSAWYTNRGIQYQCIDLSGENGAIPMDLSLSLKKYEGVNGAIPGDGLATFPNTITFPIPGLLVDAGTSEHIGTNGAFNWEAIYNCWVTKYELLKLGGIMYNENPLTGNWPLHGFNYYTESFYLQLAEEHGLFKIKDIGTHPAMGNEIDGYNVYCTLQKHDNPPPFITLDQFMKLDLRQH